jgi:hypothetical protein
LVLAFLFHAQSSVMSCINTDISGIGVRTATYAQNLLSFLPAVVALVDGDVDENEKDYLEAQSTTILLSAFALLFSAIIQARTQGLDSHHASIVLNLSWMNNTNTFIYMLLLLHRNASINPPAKWRWRNIVAAMFNPGEHIFYRSPTAPRPGTIRRTTRLLIQWGDPVILIGTLHLSLMGALGVWLWIDPGQFGKSAELQCPPGSISLLTHVIPVASHSLRVLSLIIYSTVLVPGVNLIIPISLIFTPYFLYLFADKEKTLSLPLYAQELLAAARSSPVSRLGIGLITLFIINILFIVDTELSISRAEALQQDQDAIWTFGQTLALMLLLLSLWDIFDSLLQRKRKVEEKREAMNKMKVYQDTAEWEDVENWLTLIGGTRGAEIFGITIRCIYLSSSGHPSTLAPACLGAKPPRHRRVPDCPRRRSQGPGSVSRWIFEVTSLTSLQIIQET